MTITEEQRLQIIERHAEAARAELEAINSGQQNAQEIDSVSRRLNSLYLSPTKNSAKIAAAEKQFEELLSERTSRMNTATATKAQNKKAA